jgi:hypothetical protein
MALFVALYATRVTFIDNPDLVGTEPGGWERGRRREWGSATMRA